MSEVGDEHVHGRLKKTGIGDENGYEDERWRVRNGKTCM